MNIKGQIKKTSNGKQIVETTIGDLPYSTPKGMIGEQIEVGSMTMRVSDVGKPFGRNNSIYLYVEDMQAITSA